MKKKILTLSIVLLCLMSLTYAFVYENREINLNTSIESELNLKGIDSWTYQDYIGKDKMYRCLISGNEFNLPCSNRFDTYWINCSRYNYTIHTYINGSNITKIYYKIEDCIDYERINYSSSEKETILDDWESEMMIKISNALKDRRTEDFTLVRQGTVSIR